MRTKEDPPDIFKEQNTSLLNLRSYDSEYESIPLRARVPLTLKISSSPSSSSTIKTNYQRSNTEQQYYDDLYNQNQYYHITSIADIHSKQKPKTNTSNYSLASIFSPDQHHHHRETTLSSLNNNASSESTFCTNLPTIFSSSSPIYRVSNNYENNNSSNRASPIASITPTALLNYHQTPLQALYAQKFNNNKYFNSNQNR